MHWTSVRFCLLHDAYILECNHISDIIKEELIIFFCVNNIKLQFLYDLSSLTTPGYQGCARFHRFCDILNALKTSTNRTICNIPNKKY